MCVYGGRVGRETVYVLIWEEWQEKECGMIECVVLLGEASKGCVCLKEKDWCVCVLVVEEGEKEKKKGESVCQRRKREERGKGER